MNKLSLDRSIDSHYDVIIIGGGINGAGAFRELCLQGLKCLLIDKSDFSSGTSAAPSRLIHGGLKYIETGEFRLVAESTLERNLLLKNASHFVKPLPTYVPATSYLKGVVPSLKTLFGWPSSMTSRGAFLIKAGLTIYDWYGRNERTMPCHKMMFGKNVFNAMPALSSKIVALGSYYDALIMQPERLVLELVEDGLKVSSKSKALNYASLLSGDKNGVIIHDLISSEKPRTQADIVINAAGPWIDIVNAALGEETAFIGGNKGSHILLDHPQLVKILGEKMVYFEGEDGRILLAFVYHGNVLAGSTDIPAIDPDKTKCTDAEVDYFLDCLRQLFPDVHLTQSQIVFTYSGIRPLPNAKGLAPGLVSRDHSMPVLEKCDHRAYPVLSLVGGKWTTFRAFAEQICDEVLKRKNKQRVVSSKHIAIGGGRNYPKTPSALRAEIDRLNRKYLMAPDHIENLISRYGLTKSETIIDAMSKDERTKPTLIEGLLLGEIQWVCHNEMVHHLDDIILRRCELVYAGLTGAGLHELSLAISQSMHWTEEKLADEQSRLTKILIERHGIQWTDQSVKYISDTNLE